MKIYEEKQIGVIDDDNIAYDDDTDHEISLRQHEIFDEIYKQRYIENKTLPHKIHYDNIFVSQINLVMIKILENLINHQAY